MKGKYAFGIRAGLSGWCLQQEKKKKTTFSLRVSFVRKTVW